MAGGRSFTYPTAVLDPSLLSLQLTCRRLPLLLRQSPHPTHPHTPLHPTHPHNHLPLSLDTPNTTPACLFCSVSQSTSHHTRLPDPTHTRLPLQFHLFPTVPHTPIDSC